MELVYNHIAVFFDLYKQGVNSTKFFLNFKKNLGNLLFKKKTTNETEILHLTKAFFEKFYKEQCNFSKWELFKYEFQDS